MTDARTTLRLLRSSFGLVMLGGHELESRELQDNAGEPSSTQKDARFSQIRLEGPEMLEIEPDSEGYGLP